MYGHNGQKGSRFCDDQFLKLFSLFFAHDSFAQEDAKYRFEDFLSGWRDLRHPLACPPPVGWNSCGRSRPQTRVLPFAALRRRGDLPEFFEIFRTDRRKRNSHPHTCLCGDHFSPRVIAPCEVSSVSSTDAPVAVMSWVCAVIVNGLPRLSFPRTRIGTRKAIRCSLRRPTRPPKMRLAYANRLSLGGSSASVGPEAGQEGQPAICIGVNSMRFWQLNLSGSSSETILIPAGV